MVNFLSCFPTLWAKFKGHLIVQLLISASEGKLLTFLSLEIGSPSLIINRLK